MRQYRKLLWAMVVLRLLDGTSTLLKVFQRMEGNSTNTCIHVFSPGGGGYSLIWAI